MTGTLIHVTKAGRAALVALGNAGTAAHKVTTIGVSTGAFDDTDETLTILPGERKRISTISGENVAADTIHVTLKDDTADQYSLYGFGLYLENGILFAVYSQTTPIMEKSPAAMLLLAADMQFTTIDAAQLYFGDATFTNPPATTERQGVVELATDDESQDGEDGVRSVTPSGLRQFGFQFGVPFSTNVNTDLTKKHVGKAIQWFGADNGLFRLPAGASLKGGSTFYFYNQGAGRLVIGLQDPNDFIWTAASRGSITLMRGESAIITARGGQEFDLAGGTAALKYTPRLLLNGADDDLTSALQANGPASLVGGLTIKGGRTGSLSTGNFDGLSIEAFNPTNTEKRSIALAPYGGDVLIGTTTNNGSGRLQVQGSARVSDTVFFGESAGSGWANADANGMYFCGYRSVTIGSQDAAGVLSLVAGAREAARFHPSGRLLLNGALDDGATLINANGPIKGIASNSALRASNGGGTGQTSIMLTREGAPIDQKRWEIAHGADGQFMLRTISDGYSAEGPAIVVSRATGYQLASMILMAAGGRVVIGGQGDNGSDLLHVSGNATLTGDSLTVGRGQSEGRIFLGYNDGYFFSNASETGWYSAKDGKFSYVYALKNLTVNEAGVWHGGNFDPNSRVMKGGDVMAGSLIGPYFESTNGAFKAWGWGGDANQGVVFLNQNGNRNLYYDGVQYNLVDAELMINGSRAWHAGNFNPANYQPAGDYLFNRTRNTTEGLQFASGSPPTISDINESGNSDKVALTIGNNGNVAASAVIQFHREGEFAAFFGLDTDNEWRVGGRSMGRVSYRLWHEGNFDPNYAVDLATNANNNANTRVPIRSGLGGYGYVQTGTGNKITMSWDGAVRLAVDDQFQGALWHTGNLDPNAYLRLSTGGNVSGPLTLANGTPLVLHAPNGYTATLRADGTGLVGFINQAGDAWNFRINNDGPVQARGQVWAADGGGRLCEDGNIWGGVWGGGYLSNWLNTTVINLQNNINQQVPRRNQQQGNGYVIADANAVTIGWNGRYNMFTDNSYQGDLLTSFNFQDYATPRTSMDYGGVGSYTYMNTGGNPGANTLVNLPGLPGTWRVMSGAFGANGKDILYVRVS